MKQKRQTKFTLLKQCFGVLLFVVVFYLFLSVVSSRASSNSYPEITKYLQEDENQDLQIISAQIKKSQLAVRLDQTESITERRKLRFGNAIIIGDSIVEGLSDYQLLSNTQAISYRGRRTDNCEEDVKKAAALAPEALFLTYGMNDLEYLHGDAKRFADQYVALIDQVHELMPNTKIYVNAILPITEQAVKEVEDYQKVKEFNLALQSLCKQKSITFIDSGFLLASPDQYEFDGIHPKYDFYPLWLEHLLEVAGW